MTDKLILGIDAGGTKTLAQLARLESDAWHLLAQATAGAANWISNPRQARSHLKQVAEEVLRQAGLEAGQVASACLAVAGAGRPGEQEQLRRWALQAGLARQVMVVHDAAAVLAAATSGCCCGVAVIAGTGSLVWGRDASGREARALGWGPLLGDPGSGYALALEALRLAAEELDRNECPLSSLSRQVLQHLGVSAPEEFLPAIYRPEMDRPRVARLAQAVLERARHGCPRAGAIAEAEAGRLARAASQVLQRLRWTQPPVVALAGGVLAGSAWYRDRFRDALTADYSGPWNMEVVQQPAQGALYLAARQAH